jgi:hypothetical protein
MSNIEVGGRIAEGVVVVKREKGGGAFSSSP